MATTPSTNPPVDSTDLAIQPPHEESSDISDEESISSDDSDATIIPSSNGGRGTRHPFSSSSYTRTWLETEKDITSNSTSLTTYARRPQHNASVSPIGALPTEILTLIFFKITHMRSWWTGWPAVSHVCHLWRTIAFSYRELWATPPSFCVARIATEASGNPILQPCSSEQSGDLPLSESINIVTSHCKDQCNHAISQLLKRPLNRCDTLRMHESPNTHARLVPRLPREQRSVLESLGVMIHATGSTRFNLFDDIWARIPGREAIAPSMLVPCSQCCSAAEGLAKWYLHWLPQPMRQRTSLPYLTRLELVQVDVGELVPLNLPALEEVSIYECRGRPLLFLTAIVLSTIQPCKLRTLTILNSGCGSQGQLPTLLSLTPDLQTLHVHVGCTDDVNALANLQSGDILVPSLTSCTLCVDCEWVETMLEAISKLAAVRGRSSMREASVSQLQALRIYGAPIPPRPTSMYFERTRMWGHFEQASLEPSCLGHYNEEFDGGFSKNLERLKSNLSRQGYSQAITVGMIHDCFIMRPLHIIKTNIHWSLLEIYTRHPGSREMIEGIFRKWEDHFITILDDLHWVHVDPKYNIMDRGPPSLLYINESHPIRNTPQRAAGLMLRGITNASDVDALSTAYISVKTYAPFGAEYWGE